MTKAQVQRLETILGKLEALENEVVTPEVKWRLNSGKRELLRALQDGAR